MPLTLPLIHRPGSILFLDDDVDYLEMLGMVIPGHIQIELFSRPAGFGRRMEAETARWEADASLQLQLIDRWRNGVPLLPQILRYWSTQPDRYRLVQSCVVDYAMPGTDGLTVLNTLLDWPGSRVLLTGQADEQIAVKAFNSGLIDQFVPKQTHDITRHLLGVLRKLANTPHVRLNTLWRSVLTQEQQSLLQIPAVVEALQHLSQTRWVEHVVLGAPFGMLGVTVEGRCEWLQLEPVAGLPGLAELAGSAGMDFETVRAVRAGEQLAAVELHQQLGLRGPIRVAPAQPLDEDGLLTSALFPLEAGEHPPLPAYRAVLRAAEHRSVDET